MPGNRHVRFGERLAETDRRQRRHRAAGRLNFLPLELGGAPKDPRNLWPEPHSGSPSSYSKDSVENAVKKAVCAGQVTLDDAQNAMLDDWTTAKSVLGIG
ncbi:hypothetical protein AB0L41_42525 [Amycolatopsis mediterranei]|uniref:hypothetical protein n=1 Tax=Amycolatopsis mediterranei TaxID=33910 RepID=UPI0034420609